MIMAFKLLTSFMRVTHLCLSNNNRNTFSPLNFSLSTYRFDIILSRHSNVVVYRTFLFPLSRPSRFIKKDPKGFISFVYGKLLQVMSGAVCNAKSKWEKDLEYLFTDDEWETIYERAQTLSFNSHNKLIQFNVIQSLLHPNQTKCL